MRSKVSKMLRREAAAQIHDEGRSIKHRPRVKNGGVLTSETRARYQALKRLWMNGTRR